MTRAKSSDRNVIRLGACRIGDEAMATPEISGQSPCGKADILRGARADISFGAPRAIRPFTSIERVDRAMRATPETSEWIGNFTPLRNVRGISETRRLLGAHEEAL